MARRAATVEVDERLLDALKRAAADEGVAPDELVEEALRRYFGLRGLAVMDDLRDQRRSEPVELTDEDAMDLAVAEVRAQRAERRNAS
jgi:hypothetical protein